MGEFLYFGQVVNPTLLVVLGSIAAKQAKGTAQAEDSIHQFLYYCATHPNEKLRYHTSNMVLIIHINASYLSEFKDRIRSRGHFLMGSQDFKNTREKNVAVHTVSNITKNLMVSETESRVETLFHHGQK